MKKRSYSILVLCLGLLYLPQAKGMEDCASLSKRRQVVDLDETPPDNGPKPVLPRHGATKVRKTLDFGASTVDYNNQLNLLATESFISEISDTAEKNSAEEYFQGIMSESGQTHSSLIQKFSKSISLQCSFGTMVQKDQFCKNLVVLRTVGWGLYEELRTTPQQEFLIWLLATIEKALFLKGCTGNIDRESLFKMARRSTQRLSHLSTLTLQDTALMNTGLSVLEICKGLKGLLTLEEKQAASSLKKALSSLG